MINQNMYFVKAKINEEWKHERNNAQYLESDWVEGCLEIANDKKEMWQYRIKPPFSYLFAFPIEPETICRPIGWKDSSKKSIFEKDVVEITSRGGRKDRYLIWWNQEMSMMTAIPLNELEFNGNDYYCFRPNFTYETFCLMMQDPWGDFEKIEIIGNIIDEPELLKIEKKKSDFPVKISVDIGSGFPSTKADSEKETSFEF